MNKTYFKVVRRLHYNNERVSATTLGYVTTYLPNEWIGSRSCDGPLAVFTKLIHAQEFVWCNKDQTEKAPISSFEIWECEVQDCVAFPQLNSCFAFSTKEYLYYFNRGKCLSAVMYLSPLEVAFAHKVKLTKQRF